jgi:hypothetical protein
MSELEIRYAVINLLYELQDKNYLDAHIVNIISQEFQLDALEICEDLGITYNLG